MKSNREIRREARSVVRGKWFWRIFAGGGVLLFIANLAARFVGARFEAMGLQTWADYWLSKARAVASGLDLAVPSAGVAWQMTGASLFQQLSGWLFAAIFFFGVATLLLKAVRNEDNGWFRSAFGGFGRPLELLWLIVLLNLFVFCWSLLLVIPGIVSCYRYRQCWYLKSEHPEWGAGRCLRASGEMMRGRKWQAFCLDLSFFGWFFAVCILAVLGICIAKESGGSGAGALLGMASLLSGYCGLVYVMAYFFAARTVFYREASAAAEM